MYTYEIAGIPIKFKYNFDKYFKNSIENYSKQIDKPGYNMNVEVLDIIEAPSGKPQYAYRNRTVYESDLKRTTVLKSKKGTIMEIISHTYDFTSVDIFLSNRLREQLPEQEYTLSGLFFMAMALNENMLSLHASAIEINNRAILFSGVSGTGKTTHVNNWQTLYGPLPVINDDKPIISAKDDSIMVHGSPFSGKESININKSLPLGAIIFLRQGKENKVVLPSKKEAVQLLLKNIYRPDSDLLMEKALKLCETIIKFIPIYVFHATIDASSAEKIHSHLTKEGVL